MGAERGARGRPRMVHIHETMGKPRAATVSTVDITLIRWPAEAERLPELRDGRVPRLLLVDSEAPPPIAADEFEDWVRMPAPSDDVQARIEGLTRRAEAAGHRHPEIDQHGVIRFNGSHTTVPPVEARIAEVLVAAFDTVVGRDVLTEAGWPGGHANRNALDVHVLRLRRRLAEVGLSIRTVRSRGYLLEAGRA